MRNDTWNDSSVRYNGEKPTGFIIDIHSREYLKYLENYSLQEKRWILREFERFSDGNSSYSALDIDVKRARADTTRSKTSGNIGDESFSKRFYLCIREYRRLLFRNVRGVA